jgi:DNA polymerase-3 subunit epsilon
VSTPWHLGRLAGFDVESTGVDTENDRIVSSCVVQCDGGQRTSSIDWIVDPGVEIPAEAAAIHKITTEKARAEGQPAVEAVEQIIVALAHAVFDSVPIVIMNAPFDLTMLDREARRYGLQTLSDIVGDQLRVLDPRVLDKQVDTYRNGGRTLTDLCALYGVVLDGAHSADADALAAVQVTAAIAEKYPQVQGDVNELHARQVKWAKAQQLSLASHYRRTPGKEHRAEGLRTEWPLIPFEGVAS